MAGCKYPIKIVNMRKKFNPQREYAYLKVPCGKCSKCMQRKSREWIFRLKQELKVSTSAFFITMTYADEHLEHSESGIPTLVKSHVQKYIKRVRRKMTKITSDKTVYFACGEYSPGPKRPHYHAIVFNADKDILENEWRKGIIHIGTVTENSMAYTTKYIMKQTEQWEKKNMVFDKTFQRQFVLMSKGIGKSYFENNQIKQYHKNNLDKPYMEDEKGYRYPIPRYFKEKIFTDDEIKVVNRNSSDFMEGMEANTHAKREEAERTGQRNPYEVEVEHSEWEEHIFQKRIKQNSKL